MDEHSQMTGQPEQYAPNGRRPRPSARLYYPWQIAMWVTILHAALAGPLLVWGAAGEYRVGDYYQLRRAAMAMIPVHQKVGFWFAREQGWFAIACVLAAPIAIIGCHLRSMERRGKGWMLAYWVIAGILALLPVAGAAAFPNGVLDSYGYLLECRDLGSTLLGVLFGFLPLPVTLLVAVLAREGRKDVRIRAN